MLRKFSPALLNALELTQDIEGEQSACLCALQMLRELNATGRRKLPEDAPTEFLPQRLKPIVINHGEIDRRAWECALLLKLRDELKAGNLSVRYSKRFARLEEFFIDDLRWQGIREAFFAVLVCPPIPSGYRQCAAEIGGIECGGIHQGQECNSRGEALFEARAKLRWAADLGPRFLR
jgi:hypothetical protein